MNNPNTKCKYVTPDSIIVYEMIELLYDVLEEHNGGLAHIVASENNLDDESLKCVIEECSKEENQNRHDVSVCKVLCESLLRLTLNQRYFIFAFIESEYSNIDDLKGLLTDECTIGHSGICNDHCDFKYWLDKFYTEKRCIEATGSNTLFLYGKWPLEVVKEV